MTTLAKNESALGRLLDPFTSALTLEAARVIADFRLDPATQAEIDDLADRCTEGTLTELERQRYAAYVEGINVLNILKSKARRAMDRMSES